MPDLYVGSVALAPFIVALIALLKWIGMPVGWAPYVNIALSAAGVILIGMIGLDPNLLTPVETVLNIVIAVLAAAGFYDLQQAGTRALRSQ